MPATQEPSVYIERTDDGEIRVAVGMDDSATGLHEALASLPAGARLDRAITEYYCGGSYDCGDDCEGRELPDDDHWLVVLHMYFRVPALPDSVTVPDDLSGLLA